MTDSTTLMTFLVRAPPITRSVSLMGSWDNFTRPYPMKRDARVGPEHWTGCHIFENIICDGSFVPNMQKRDGGLKMGCTYWYYYRLDDDIEFHNSAETSTTSCPMLPGQLVNVLYVPAYFSGTRQRNDSFSSTSSRNRTMDPHDKYLNPRPAPQPALPRLNTSPALHLDPISATSTTTASPWSGFPSFSSQSTSQPTSATGLRMFRLPRKASVDGPGRSISPQSRIGGLRAMFGSSKTSRTDNLDEVARGRSEEPEVKLNISPPIMQHRTVDNRSVKSSSSVSSPASSRQVSPHPITEVEASGAQGSYFALRRPMEEGVELKEAFITTSFQEHRRQRSRSREPSNLRRSLALSDEHEAEEPAFNVRTLLYQPLDTLKEVASAQNTPIWPITARRVELEPVLSPVNGDSILQKRLPTLPNTPSSAYPPSMSSDSPAKPLDKQLGALHSHFSSSTWDSIPGSTDDFGPKTSHFSTASSEMSLRDSDQFQEQSEYDTQSAGRIHVSSFALLGSPLESRSADTLVPLDRFLQNSDQMVSTTSYSTISSTLSTSPSSPESESFEFEHISLDTGVGNGKPRGLVTGHVQAYRLPDLSPDASGPLTCVKTTPIDTIPPHGLDFASPLKAEFEVPTIATKITKHNQLDSQFHHSESMQQLLQELSYLGNMIQK